MLVLAGYAPSLLNFRGPLLRTVVAAGYEVIACAPGIDSGVEARLRELGASYEALRLHRTGLNPFKDLQGFAHLYRLIRKYRPEVILSYTIKPVIYGSLAASLVGVPRIYSIVTGLGYIFTEPCSIKGFVRRLYKLALNRNDVVFFQNRDDEAEFRRLGILPREKQAGDRPSTVILNGSGVDLEHYTFHSLPTDVTATAAPGAPSTDALTHPPAPRVTFLLVARLLRYKGPLEFAAAARELKHRYPACRFQLLGPYDSNPNAFRADEIREWTDSGAIEYLGEAEDVRPFLRACDVYVLPSYREGTPRAALEAMAIGRPIITTDAPGCRETVVGAGEGGGSSVVSASDAPSARVIGSAVLGEQKGGGSLGPSTSTSPHPTHRRTDAPSTPPPLGVTRGRNGFLVPVRDATSLAWAMEQFILHPELREQMGYVSRQYVEQRYDVHKVNAVILGAMGLAS